MQKFPFPGSQGSETRPKPSTPSLTGVPDIPATPAAPNATKQFPFPGEASTPPPADAVASSSSSSSSSSGDDAPQFDPSAADATPALTDKGSGGAAATPGRHILHRVNPRGTKLQSSDEREAEDLSVARFYMDSGDLSGAYLRGQDAVKIAPDDPEAHLVLAESALKLNKRDVAVAEYNACLKLDPPEKQARQARKELARLQH
jgi:tetratricopeptide (TPR) repeat protein